MVKFVAPFLFLLVSVEMMQATPVGFLLPALSQITDNKPQPAIYLERLETPFKQITKAALEQVVNAVSSAITVIEIERGLVEIDGFLRANAGRNIPAIQQSANEIAAATTKAVSDILESIRALLLTFKNETPAFAISSVQTIVEVKINAVNRLVLGVRDLLRSKISPIDFEKIQADVVQFLMDVAARVIGVGVLIFEFKLQIATQIVDFVTKIVDSIIAVSANASANLGDVKVNLEALNDYLQQIAKDPSAAIKDNVVVQDVANKINELMNVVVSALRRI